MKKVLAFGTFDGLHPGHIFFLNQAKALGDYLTVIIGRDETVRDIKERSPTNNELTRKQNLEALGIARKVRLGNLDDKYQVLAEEKPDIIALGYDQTYFTDDLTNRVSPAIAIVRLPSFHPERYKSSKLRSDEKSVTST